MKYGLSPEPQTGLGSIWGGEGSHLAQRLRAHLGSRGSLPTLIPDSPVFLTRSAPSQGPYPLASWRLPMSLLPRAPLRPKGPRPLS